MTQQIDIHHDILNNSQRPFFGLNPIDPEWDEVEIKPGYTLFFDGNVVKKVISFLSYRAFDEYREYDTELPTRERQFVLPKTAKGKEKKLNYTSVNAVMPSGVEINLKTGEYSSLWVGNCRNAISLPLPEGAKPATIEEFQQWRDAYIADSPLDHFEKVDRMRNLPHRTIRYFNGDIFRFDIGREHYGFGIIIGQIRKMQKDGIIPERHAFNFLMTVPLLVRYYQIKTKNRDLAMEEITSSPLLPTVIMSDASLLWGSVDIVGSKQLQAEDIHFPMNAGRPIPGSGDYFCFCWGTGSIVTEDKNKIPSIRNQKYSLGLDFFIHGVSLGIDDAMVERAMRGESPRTNDLSHPDYASFKEKVCELFELPLDITFDEFNSKHGGMTRQQYADYANKYLRTEKTITANKSTHLSKKKG